MSNPFENIDNRLLKIESALAELISRKAVVQEKKYYSISEAAAKLHVARITLYRNAKLGKIPIKQIGARIMIPGSYVDSQHS